MAYREFVDGDGSVWAVWDTYPESGDRVDLGAYRQGWLTFQNGEQRRRLAPVPDGWHAAPDGGLQGWLAAAASVKERLRGSAFRERVISIRPPEPPRESIPAPARATDDIRALIEHSRETVESVIRAIERPAGAMQNPPRSAGDPLVGGAGEGVREALGSAARRGREPDP